MQVIAIPKYYMPGAYERIAYGPTTLAVLTASLVTRTADGRVAQAVLIVLEGEAARWTDDGTTPTTGASGNGSPMGDGDSKLLQGAKSLKGSQWIGLTGSGVIHAHYYY